VAATASARTVWLCRPGLHPDPCTPGLSTTVYSPTLRKLRVVHPRAAHPPKVDCFYVYPTVSDQPTTYSNLQIDPEERSAALYQAARYSQYCRVFAPMYRQVTDPALLSGTPENADTLRLPLSDLRRAFDTYLRRYSHGRGFILIGHSQGSFLLEELIAQDIDRKPALRRRLVSAILLGGQVLVRAGRGVGGTFQHVPACRSDTQLSCVIAFSSFDLPPPPDSFFGRSPVPGDQVLCTNPGALGGGSADLDPIIPAAPFAPGSLLSAAMKLLELKVPTPPTVWVSEPNGYRARCEAIAGAHVLELSPLHGAQVIEPSLSPQWGLHLVDANIALGNLLTVVRHEAAAYVRRAGPH
jgi:hypothetical protein